MIDAIGLPATFSTPFPDTRMLTPWTQPEQAVPKLPKTLLSPRAAGLSMNAVMLLMPALRFWVAMAPVAPAHAEQPGPSVWPTPGGRMASDSWTEDNGLRSSATPLKVILLFTCFWVMFM